MAFYPKRFDDAFLAMLDRFHETYPDVGLRLMLHFNHPDEILIKDDDGASTSPTQGDLRVAPRDQAKAMRELCKRGWMTVENQAPIIKDVNDDPDALRILQREFKRVGVENHYFFCGRDIVAYRAFNVPIETAWHDAQRVPEGALRRRERTRASRSRTTRARPRSRGHQRADPRAPGHRERRRDLQDPAQRARAPDRGKVCIVGRNPDALWFDDYEDRVTLRRGRPVRLRPRGREAARADRRRARGGGKPPDDDDRQASGQRCTRRWRTSSTARA
jgi:lysine 2,3-aminomutase